MEERELIMIIVALEWWKGRPSTKIPQGLERNFDKFPPLTVEEIDALIERLRKGEREHAT